MSEDLTGNWLIEANDRKVEGDNFVGPDNWTTVWETWWVDDPLEVTRIEREYSSRGETLPMTPRPFIECLEKLQSFESRHGLRTKENWDIYRFRNTTTDLIIYASILR